MASPSVPRERAHIPRGGVSRVLPFGSRHSVHILERTRFIFRRGWMVIFSGFFELFFPEWAGRFDFTQVAWLDKEIFSRATGKCCETSWRFASAR